MSLKHFMIILPVHGLSPQEGQASILFLIPKTIQIRLHSMHKWFIDEFDIRRKDYFKEETRSINQIIFNDKSKAEKFLSDLSNETQFNKLAKDKYNNENSIIDDIKKGDLPTKFQQLYLI